MLFKRTPVLVSEGSSNRPIALIIGCLAFILTLMISATLALNHFVASFQNDLKNNLVFEVNLGNLDPLQHTQTLSALQQTLNGFPSVRGSLVFLTPSHAASALSSSDPIGGTVASPSHTAFLEVRVHPQAPLSIEDVVTKLRQIHSNVHLQSHQFIQANLLYLYQSLTYFSYGIMGLVSLIMIGTISLITRSGLRVHKNVIDILRLIGAPNAYVARQFQWVAFRLGFLASLFGVVVGMILFVSFTTFGERFGLSKDFMIFDQNLLTTFVALPLFIAFLSLFVARFEVIRTLIKLEV